MFATKLRVLAVICLWPVIGTNALAGNDEIKKSGDSIVRVFAVMGMNCDDCANKATDILIKVSGVRQASVDFSAKQARVESNPEVSRDALRAALASIGFEAVFPGETIQLPLTSEEKASLDIRVISHGERVDLESHLSVGRITIVDYYADWCGPCHILSPKLEHLLLKYENLALRKVDIHDWKSDAAKQATHEFRLTGLPYVRVYDTKGEFVGAVVGNHADQVEALVRKAAKQ